MSINRTFIAIVQRSRKQPNSTAQLIGIATNYLEAFKILHQATDDEDAVIASGAAHGHRANYPRLMQSLKAFTTVEVHTAKRRIEFIVMRANNFYSNINLNSNTSKKAKQ